jgi:zinc/manganese transport system permease protein
LSFCVTGGVVIGLLGKKTERRDVATGTILAFATALGVLFSSMSTQNASAVTSVLFGSLLTISTQQLWQFGALTVLLLLALAIIARPLLFASINPYVAEAKGVAVRALGVAFMVILAVAIAMAVQVVGTLLLFALVVTPAATALIATARPSAVVALATSISLASIWLGLLLSAMFNLPPSFPIVSIVVLTWLAALAARSIVNRQRHKHQSQTIDLGDVHTTVAEPVGAQVKEHVGKPGMATEEETRRIDSALLGVGTVANSFGSAVKRAELVDPLDSE